MPDTPVNYYSFIDQTLRRTPDQVCLIWPEPSGSAREITGHMLLSQVAACRALLHKSGVGPGDAVLLASPVSLPVITLLLAIMAHGAIPVLPPASATIPTLLRLLLRHRVRGLVLARKLPVVAGWLLRLRGIRLIPVSAGLPDTSAAWAPPTLVPPGQPALISHSSGSTGMPNAIRRSHRVLTEQHHALDTAFPAWPGQRDFPLFPAVLLLNLATGTTSVLPDLPGLRVTAMQPRDNHPATDPSGDQYHDR